MYHLYVEGSKNQLKFLNIIGIADQRKKIIPLMIKKLKEIIPNPNIDIVPKEAWKLIIKPFKEKIDMSWRTFAQELNMAYCGTSLFKNGIGRERMTRIYKIFKEPIISNLANSNIYWDKIISIKKLKVQKVYDATVKGAHNFVANDIIVHNSLEQDADVVLLIYREDKDRTSSERKNIAEIHIAKHRNGPTGKIELFFNESQASFKNLERRLGE